MRINSNISAMVTQGALYQVGNAMSKSLQQLSTGLRINSASDDAAGLGVSENLRAQANGMNQAIRNTQDAIAMLNIADGALSEQGSILQRMREIIIQAKNDTYTSTERSYMYQEFSSDMQELDRIDRATNYNGMTIFADPANNPAVNGDELYPANTATAPDESNHANTVFANPAEGIFGATELSSSNHFNMMIGQNYTAQDAAAYNHAVILGASQNSYEPSAPDMETIQFGQMDANGILNPGPGIQDIYGFVTSFDMHSSFADPQFNIDDFAIDHYMTDNGDPNNHDENVQKKLDFLLRIIDDTPLPAAMIANTFQGRDNTTGIPRINQMRAYIGATINQMQHTLNNLMNQSTNTQAAETTIRDVDFAQATSTYAKNQILMQSATAMLAQSNSQPKAVLQLLKF